MWNQVADSLSCYYKYDTVEDEYTNSELIKADKLLDPDRDLAPVQQFIEIWNNMIRRLQRLQEKIPAAQLESQMLNETFNNIPVKQEYGDNDTIAYMSANNRKPLLTMIEKEFDLNKIIMKFYWQDKIYSKILENPKAHVRFGIKQGLIFTKNNLSKDVICISLKAIHKGKWLIKIIINHAHNMIGHFGQFYTTQYIRRYFLWPSMSHDIEAYCKTCGICATTKDTNSKLAGLLDSLPILDRPWQSIGMDFMGPLLKSNNFNYLLVIVNQLTSQVHFVPTTTTVTTRGIMWLILREVVGLHGISESIMSDKDTKFTSIFWKELHRLMGSKLLMSTAFHPQTDEVME